MMSRSKNIFVCFFLGFILLYKSYCEENVIRKNSFLKKKQNDSLYKSMYAQYTANTKRKDLLKNDIRYIVPFVKEIDLTENNNAKMFKAGHKDLIDSIFTAIYSGEIIAYKDKSLTKKMLREEVKKNILMPKNVEALNNGILQDQYFNYEDISILEIDGYYVSTIAYPKPVMDHVVLTLLLSANLFDDGIQHFVCCVQYAQCMDLLSKKKIYVYKNGKRIDIDKAIENDIFNYMFLRVDNISINQKYKIKNKKYDDNHIIAKAIFRSKREDVIL